jgi:lysophospholipase
MLSSAGVVQALDGTDSQLSTSGLYQALIYHAGLSGGSWLLSSLVGNGGDARVSALQRDLWTGALEANSIWPTNILFAEEGPPIRSQLETKQAAGFDPTIPDTWGRFISYQILRGADGGAATRMSDVLKIKDFNAATIPFPIITALAKTGGISGDSCDPELDSPQFEFTPYETGSWDNGIGAFTPTAFLGTEVSNGSPVGGQCIKNFDNLGYLFGASSARFEESCGLTQIGALGLFLQTYTPFQTDVVSEQATGQDPGRRNLYAPVKNPFFGYAASNLVSQDKELYLLDGGTCKYAIKLTARRVDLADQNIQPCKIIPSGPSSSLTVTWTSSSSTTTPPIQTTTGPTELRSYIPTAKHKLEVLPECPQYPSRM